MSDGLTDSVVIPDGVAWAQVGDELVVHRPGALRAHVLDPIASVIWQCLDGESVLADVMADIADVVELPIAVVTADCLPVVESWIEFGIARIAPADDLPARRHRHLQPPPNA